MLRKFDSYYSHYTDPFGGTTLKSIEVYAADRQQVGAVKNILVDEETGRFRYLIVDTGLGYVGRQVLIPVGLVQLDDQQKCIRISQLTQQQIEDLPDFAGELRSPSEYGEQINHIHASLTSIKGIHGTRVPISHSEIYDRPDYCNTTGSFRDYEASLIAQQHQSR